MFVASKKHLEIDEIASFIIFSDQMGWYLFLVKGDTHAYPAMLNLSHTQTRK